MSTESPSPVSWEKLAQYYFNRTTDLDALKATFINSLAMKPKMLKLKQL